MAEPLPIEAFIVNRLAELGLKPKHLVQRCGYKNVSKGIRRLRELYVGGFAGAEVIIRGLPTALEVKETVVAQALEDSRRMVEAMIGAARARENLAYRASFVPHAIIVTEQSVPEPIFVAALIGVHRLLIIEFDTQYGEITFPLQAKAGVAQKLADWGRNGVPAKGLPAFSRPVEFIVNYSPDGSIKYDLDLNPIEVRNYAVQPGGAKSKIRNRTLPEGFFSIAHKNLSNEGGLNQ